MPPQTQYTKSDGLNIAYQTLGDGPMDLVYVPGWVSHVELAWELPDLARCFERIASFARLILFDKRGTGMSDPTALGELPTLEERMDDVRAVMDAVGSRSATLFGASEGGNMSILFAATYPERTNALCTFGCFAKRLRSDDYPWAPTLEERKAAIESVERDWTTGLDVADLAPSMDAEQHARVATYLRRSASPGAAVALLRMNTEIDVRDVLAAIRVPTLVMHRVGDIDAHIEEARFLASRIDGARLVELQGTDHLWWTQSPESIIDEIEELVTGARPDPMPDRILATVLFTDLVGSTDHVRTLGDRRWADLLTRHDSAVRAELERFRGREVDTAGDGLLATFDGPARAVRCALAIRDAIGALGLTVRAGLHTGECELDGDKVRGIAVHTGARISSLAGPGEVLVSSTVHDLVAGSGIALAAKGEHDLKGVGRRQLFSVVSA